ncbi:hypothetical protein IV73_GL000046 [Weissella kandleri]|uniref:ATP-dependent RNA helicase n=1 Tax=Weissella kandleri TaxID=1616 RepID=A0A0R2JMB9_9LACO|nr:DEAD/DEAH box helicase [Weissella kandleri]KRN75562.1 hypothetical protein IV73_GL000046 [Weissella kandleri]
MTDTMDERLAQKFAATGFIEQTPIQKAVFEPLVTGQSIDALAPTGTGKTLAFTWPLLPLLQPNDGEQLLILAPSQELAMQTTRVVREWAQGFDLKVLALTGGANVKNQLDRLKKHPEILVGTPGRVGELAASKKLKLQRLRTLILDEADILLQDETADQIQNVWELFGDEDIQVAMFGATAVINQRAQTIFRREFTRIDLRDVQMPTSLQHQFVLTANDQKNKRLRQLATRKGWQAMVFFNTTKALKQTASFLAHEHVAMATLVRGDSSRTRASALEAFRNGQAKFLLTTDVAARGLDVIDLPAVINYDLPRDGETYTHRAGRTGRMGRTGKVVTFGNDHDLRDLKRMVQVEIDVLPWQQIVEQSERAKSKTPAYGKNGWERTKPQAVPKKSNVKAQTAKLTQEQDLDKPRAKQRSTWTIGAPVTEPVKKSERLAKEKKAKRRNQKDKGKPKHKLGRELGKRNLNGRDN